MHALPILALLIAALYYCHRFYGVWFPFEGDSLNFLYFRLHSDLVRQDHNPYQWESMLGYPTGEWNPLLWLVQGIVFLFSSDPQAVVVCGVLSMLTQFLLSLSFYFLFWERTRNRVAACLGASVVSYTGFHLIGVREFNTMYAHSFFCTAGVLWATLKRDKRYFFGVVSLCTGLSLLGGTNSPLFYFVPWILLYFLFKKENRTYWFFSLLGALAVGLLIGSLAWLPKLSIFNLLERSAMSFWGVHPLEWKDFWVGLFFPEIVRPPSWSKEWWNVQETSFFLGAPVTWLFGVGLLENRKDPKARLFYFLLAAGICVMATPHLPQFLSKPISSFYSLLSIRNPNRFFLLCLPSIGFFVAKGLHSTTRGSKPALAVVFFMAVTFYFAVLPHWEHLLPEARPSILLCSLASILGVLALQLNRKKAALFLIFLMYAWAPLQSTLHIWNAYFFPNERTLQPNSLDPKNVLGLSFNYSDLIEEARRRLTVAPPDFPTPETLTGRLFDETSYHLHDHYFAPATGHRFAFSAIGDPATFRYQNQLALMRTDAILGMSHVCTKVGQRKNENNKTFTSIDCLPFAFWTESALYFPNEEDGMEWMKKATLKDYSQTLALFDSPTVVPRGEKSQAIPLVSSERPGKIDIKGEAPKGGYVFISTPFRNDWKTKVNGVLVRPVRANLGYLAIWVDEGPFSIEMALDPLFKQIAYALTFFGILLSLVPLLKPELKHSFRYAEAS